MTFIVKRFRTITTIHGLWMETLNFLKFDIDDSERVYIKSDLIQF